MTPRGNAKGMLRSLRKGFAGRVASWLCLGVFVATLLGPLSAAAASALDDPLLKAIAASVCHVGAPDEDGEAVLPGPHCPLCLIGGALWMPSSRVPEPVRLMAEAETLIPPADLDRPAIAAGTIRPATRAPPALT